jgi:hypothetical protein
LWLHWRLAINRMKRGGLGNTIVLCILAVIGVIVAVTLFGLLFLAGIALADSAPSTILYVWDGTVAVFLFVWLTGLVSSLQRSEMISLDKFLHLPVSLSTAFLLNYLCSLFTLTLMLAVPAMVGLSLGLVVGRGATLLLLLPLLAAFLLMVTAVTYQFQGWLASLMANKRRRQTVLLVVTTVFILLAQLPNLLNILYLSNRRDARAEELAVKRAELERDLSEHKITPEEYHRRRAKLLVDADAQTAEEHQEKQDRTERTAWLINLILPVGWLPLGAMGLGQGDVVPALLGTVGLTLIGAASLWRSYHTTLRIYTGQYTSGRRRAAPAAPAKVEAAPTSSLLLEKRLPWLPEHASAVALSSFRSLTRAPEARMALLGSVLMVVIFGGLLMKGLTDMPASARPLLPFAAMGLILMSLTQLVGNQFGYDRNGFRVFVLCGASRRDILLGKNLALAPFALTLGLLVVIVLEIIAPLRVDALLALPLQFISMFLLFCMVANWLSILAPVRIPPGALRAPKMGAIATLLHLVFFLILFPVVMAPTLLPLGIELVLAARGWLVGVPVALLLSAAECLGVVFLYGLVLGWQGQVLQEREQKILAVVMTRAE